MGGLMPVIPAKAGIQGPNQVVSSRKSGTSHTLDSGFRRSDEVVISYAIALNANVNALNRYGATGQGFYPSRSRWNYHVRGETGRNRSRY